MSNKNAILKDKDGNSIFPKTFDFNVFNSSNQSLDNIIANIDATKMKVFSCSAYNCNTCYDSGLYQVANGTNCPSGSQYGTLLVMPYRRPFGNSTPDFATQIFIPNGDDSTDPNNMFYRTSLGGSWNAWQKVATTDAINNLSFFNGRSRTLIGNYSCNDNTTVNVGSLANYRCFEIVFTGVGSRKISTGINSCVNGTYFSCYYPNVGGIRGYKNSDTTIRVEDVDGTTTWALYGIN